MFKPAKFIGAVLLIINLVGCAFSDKSPTREYPYWISPKFSDEHALQLVRAVDDWDNALQGFLIFRPTSLEQQGMLKFKPTTIDGLIVRHHERLPDVDGKKIVPVGWCHSHGSVSDIEMAVDIKDESFNWVAKHELGHAFGLNHAGKNTLMCDNLKCASPEITAEDLKQFHKVWDE